MILKLVLELLALLGPTAEQIETAVAEVHSSDPTSKKIGVIAGAAGKIAASAAAVASTVEGN